MSTQKPFPTKAAFVIANPKSPLLAQLREVLRVKHYSIRTEEAYTQWALRFLKYHRDQSGAWKHPRDLGAAEVVEFLNHLATVNRVAASTQNQALNAIVFLYTQVLGMDLGDLGEFLHASRGASISVMAEIMGGLPSTLREVQRHFGESVEFQVHDKRNPINPISLVGCENLHILNSEGTKDHVKHRLSVSLEQHLHEGRISDECYRQSLGSAPITRDERMGTAGNLGNEKDGDRRSLQEENCQGSFVKISSLLLS